MSKIMLLVQFTPCVHSSQQNVVYVELKIQLYNHQDQC